MQGYFNTWRPTLASNLLKYRNNGITILPVRHGGMIHDVAEIQLKELNWLVIRKVKITGLDGEYFSLPTT